MSEPAPHGVDMGWRAFSGARLELAAPSALDIKLSDIAHGLAGLPRFNRQSERTISVAEHSVIVARLCPPNFQLAALLHDAHEFALGDLSRPLFGVLRARIGERFGLVWESLRSDMDRAICRRVLMDFAPDWAIRKIGVANEADALAAEMTATAVRLADDRALRLELAIRHDWRGAEGADADCARREYPFAARDPFGLAEDWLMRVRALTLARFAGGRR